MESKDSQFRQIKHVFAQNSNGCTKSPPQRCVRYNAENLKTKVFHMKKFV